MSVQHLTSEVASPAKVELNLDIVMIDDTVLRMPYAAVGVEINAVHTQVVRMPYAAGRMNLQATKTILNVG